MVTMTNTTNIKYKLSVLSLAILLVVTTISKNDFINSSILCNMRKYHEY